MTAAGVLPPEKRSVFLERIAARLNLRDPRLPISDTDLSKAIRSALTGLAPAPPKLSGVIGYKEVIAERESTLIGPDRLTGDMSQAAASAVACHTACFYQQHRKWLWTDLRNRVQN